MSTANKISAIYNDDDIASTIPIKQGMTVRMVHSLAGEDLQVDEARITSVVDADSELEPIAFSAQAPLVLTYDGTPMGKYYARELKQKNARSSELVAYSAIWLLKLKVQPERMYAYSNASVSSVISDILGDIPHEVGSSFGEKLLRGKIPAGTAYTQLFEILLATGGNCTTGTDGKLYFDWPSDTVSSVIDSSRVCMGASIEDRNALTYLSVTAYTYTKGTAGKTYTKAYTKSSVALAAGAQKTVVLTEWYDDITISLNSTSISTNTATTTYCSFTVQHSTTSKTEVTIKNEGTTQRTFYIWGKKPDVAGTDDTITETVFSIGTPPTGIDTDNAMSITGHYLITPNNAQEVLTRIWRYYNVASVIKADIICNGEKPGDVVSIWRPDIQEMVTATIKQAEYKFGLLEYRASIEALIGYTPLSHNISYTQTMLLTNYSGNITVSQLSQIAGYTVNVFRAIIVGKGNSGNKGGNGGSTSSTAYPTTTYGTRPYGSNYVIVYNTKLSETSLSGASTPGRGGYGGGAGEAGYINDVIIYATRQTESYDYLINSYTKVTSFGIHKAENGKRYNQELSVAGYTFGGRGSAGKSGAAGGFVGESGFYVSADGNTYEGTQPASLTKTFEGNTYYKPIGGSVDPEETPDATWNLTANVSCGGAGGAYGVHPSTTSLPSLYASHLTHLTKLSAGLDVDYWCDGEGAVIKIANPQSPATPAKVTQYGMGGHGGHGGGGAGAIGSWSYSFNNRENLGMKKADLVYNGGNGGNGGEGGDGCILLLF